MEIKILQGIEGAKQAKGLTVVIDVFRAFSLEAYLMQAGVKQIIPVADKELAYEYKQKNHEILLIGERKGKILPGFDYGNSPSQIPLDTLNGKIVVHTTSAGTQGLTNAKQADEILTGSLVNAKSIAHYILKRQPDYVSLVCMGLSGIEETEEDTLCARYIQSLLEWNPIQLNDSIEQLKSTSGAKFFDPHQQDIFPQEDFFMCTKVDLFPFVLRYNVKDKQIERIEEFSYE